MRIEKQGYVLSVTETGDRIIVSVGFESTGHAIILTKDEAQSLHTDLGDMIGRFVLDDA